ncbi:MAG: response regulator transcription factor [Oscillochloris sp.]|nr:response regulator transcription factor [Oscillochloris sp.]
MEQWSTVTILIADDQENVRAALRLLLEQTTCIGVAGEAVDATGLLLLAAYTPADLLLLDWELPGLPADQLLRLVQYEQPALQVVAMSSRPEAEPEALQAGAAAFLSKGSPPETVLDILASLSN